MSVKTYIIIFLIILTIFCLWYFYPVYKPSHVLIIRHANKVVSTDSTPGSTALDSAPLNQEGKDRATNYIEELYNYAIKNYGENFKSAYAIKPSPSYSMRPEQTIMPFCFEHNVPLYLPAGITDPFLFYKFHSNIAVAENDNKPVLICFEHTCIQELVKSFGFDFDNYWNNDNYTCCIDIDVKNNTYKIVYFPFVESDKDHYIQYVNTHSLQRCK